jgi:hypothetical protein
MVAPGVESVIVTDWAAVNVPPAGEITGVAAVSVVVLIVKLSEAVELVLYPLATAIALMVSDVVTDMAAVYFVDELVGVVPSVV